MTSVFSYSSETLQVRMKQFSSLLGMSGWRPQWSNTSLGTSCDSVSNLEMEEGVEVEEVSVVEGGSGGDRVSR